VTTTAVLTIAVIGAECTGKTTLCRDLAQQQGGLWVPEALREFVDSAGRAPLAHEQATLMSEQIARESAALIAARQGRHPLVAFDSVPLATALYSQLYFADATLLGRASAHHQRYDVTLVTDIDLPWEADGLQRDGPDMRARFHDLLLDWLARERLAFTLVRGLDAERIDIALARTRPHISKALPDDR
jgi:nicotinamide riboside kinase